MQYREFECKVRNGEALHVREWGEGNDTCILVHGFGDGSFIWDRFSPSIATWFKTVSIDLRGHGESSWDPAGQYDTHSHTNDVLHVIDTLKIRQFVIIGHSLGGDIAIRIASMRPDSVIGVVIVDFGPESLAEGSERVRNDFNEGIRDWSTVSEYSLWLRARRPLANPAMIEEMARGALRAQSTGGYRPKCDPALGNDCGTERHGAEIWEMLKSISSPVLLIRGIGSAVLSRDVAARMEKILRNGYCRTVSGAGHAVMSDNPAGFAEALNPFLSQIKAALSHD